MLTRLSLAAALAAALAAGPAFADQGGNPHNGSQGNANAAQPATPAQPATHDQSGPATNSHGSKSDDSKSNGSESHGASSHTEKSQGSDSHGETKSAKPQDTVSSPSSHAKAGKTTICHATGSATNPYVEITISNNALPAHTRHQDGRDIVPAPAGGCPGASAPATTQQQSTGTPQKNGTSPKELFVAPTQTTGASQNTTNGLPSATGAGPIEAFRITPQSGVIGARAQGSTGRGGAAAPAANGGTAPRAAVLPSAATSPSRNVAGLPFTGLDLGLLAAIGLAALLAGTALRRSGRLSDQRS